MAGNRCRIIYLLPSTATRRLGSSARPAREERRENIYGRNEEREGDIQPKTKIVTTGQMSTRGI